MSEAINTHHVEQQRGKERIDKNLRIARLIPSRKFDHHIAKIIGIPFEENQLQDCSIDIKSKNIPLLRLMKQSGLLGDTEGVPHLSIGGPTTQLGGFLTWQWRTSFLQSQASRSYLVANDIGVQGMGLVQYTPNQGQIGFGLDMPFKRHSGGDDIGGGVLQTSFRRKDKELLTLSMLEKGSAPFARIYKTLPYHTWLDFDEYHGEMNQTEIIIREDGRRELPKKQLARAIWDILPVLTDFRINTPAFFESDGHNAFIKNGKVIFTDYEEIDSFSLSHDNFMYKLGDRWYFEELRQNYDHFLRIYGLKSTGIIDYKNLGEISETVSRIVHEAHYRSEIKDPLEKAIASGDPKVIVRYAMAGVIGSRAIARCRGQEMIREQIDNILTQRQGEKFTLEQMQHLLANATKNLFLERENYSGETCRISQDNRGNMYFAINLQTLGLPIEKDIVIPITLADICNSWPWDINEQKGLIAPDVLPKNPYEDVPDDLISTTMYAQVAGALTDIKGLEVFPKTITSARRIQRYDTAALNQGKVIFSVPLQEVNLSNTTFLLRDQIKVVCNGNMLTIESPKDIQQLSLSDLNKFAYAIHVAVESFPQKDLAGEIITISLN